MGKGMGKWKQQKSILKGNFEYKAQTLARGCHQGIEQYCIFDSSRSGANRLELGTDDAIVSMKRFEFLRHVTETAYQ